MKNKILTSLMAATMIMGSTMPVFAATTAQQTVNQTEADPGTTRETEVTYTVVLQIRCTSSMQIRCT